MKPFYQTNILFSFVWFETLLAGKDPDLYDALATGKAKYTDPGVVDVMNDWKKLIEAGYFSDPGAKTEPQAQLKNGEVGDGQLRHLVQRHAEHAEDEGRYRLRLLRHPERERRACRRPR